MVNLFSHRGSNNHSYKENTKEGIFSSLNKEYIKGVEFDIRLTKDKKLVLSHSGAVNINNEIKFIEDLNYLELEKVKINTLDEVLKDLKTDKILLIEIKYKRKNYKEISEVIYNNLLKYTNLNIYLCSFNYKLITYLKKQYNFKCGLIECDFVNKFKIKNNLDFNVISYNLVNKVKNKETFIWTVNKENNFKNLIKKNRDLNIITDKAYLFSSILH